MFRDEPEPDKEIALRTPGSTPHAVDGSVEDEERVRGSENQRSTSLLSPHSLLSSFLEFDASLGDERVF